VSNENTAENDVAPQAVHTGIKVSPHFKLVFWAVLILSVACLIANVTMSLMVETPNESTVHAMEITASTWTIGFGAMIGLLGGKALS
jgi:hypothetical protein